MAAAHAVCGMPGRWLSGNEHSAELATGGFFTATILSQMWSCKLPLATAATILSATFTVTKMAWDTTSRNSPAIRLRQTFGAVRVL
ncbi:MAG: hypothetical protein ACRDPL_13315, partial [Propionibacteriaceae bacterium]